MKQSLPAFWCALLIFAFYLLLYPPAQPMTDRYAAALAAINWARYGRADINALIWTQQTPPASIGAWDDDQNLYPRYGNWARYMLFPFIWLADHLPGFSPLQMAILAEGGLVAMLVALQVWFWQQRRGLLHQGCFIVTSIIVLVLISWRVFSVLRDGVIWLRPTETGYWLELHLLLPSLILLLLVGVNLWGQLQYQAGTSLSAATLITLFLAGSLMLGTTYLDWRSATEMIPIDDFFNDFRVDRRRDFKQDHLIIANATAQQAYQATQLLTQVADPALPTYVWLDDQPAAMGLNVATLTQNVVQQKPARLWLFEPGLRPSDPLGETAMTLGQAAFQLEAWWLERGGRLALYGVSDVDLPPVPQFILFEQAITLVNFAILSQPHTPSAWLKVRLTWQMAAIEKVDVSQPPLVVFIHLLDDTQPGRVVAQIDRLLVDLRNHHQSPLLPGQTIRQGYALPLSHSLTPGPYSIIIGLYEAETIQRLQRVDNSADDFLYLTTIQLEN